MTVPIVLSPDHATILALAQSTGGMVNVTILARELGWDKKRSMLALNVLLREGMTWIDEQVPHFPTALSSIMTDPCRFVSLTRPTRHRTSFRVSHSREHTHNTSRLLMRLQ